MGNAKDLERMREELFSTRSNRATNLPPTRSDNRRPQAYSSEPRGGRSAGGAYLRSGVYVHELESGCEIEQTSPLEKMRFKFFFRSKEDPNVGDVVCTSLYDKKRWYYFDTRLWFFRGNVDDVEIRGARKESWDVLEEAGLLPLNDLSPDTRQILRENAPPDSFGYTGIDKCRRIADAILGDPPQGY
ncbi:hypothetical protein FOZ63_028113, partial [Perkinsus olseni]